MDNNNRRRRRDDNEDDGNLSATRRQRTNNVDQYISSILGNYMRHFNELILMGGVRENGALVTPADELEQYSYFRLTNMSPDEIANLANTASSPQSLYYALNPSSSNFRDGGNFNYKQTLRMLLLHTNENGVLTNRVTEHGELLYAAITDLSRDLMYNNPTIITPPSIQQEQRPAANMSTQITPGSLIDMTLHEYNLQLDVLRRNGGVRAENADDELELVVPFADILTYDQLAHYSPQQILHINNGVTPVLNIFYMLSPSDDNFDELENNNIAYFDDYYTNLSRLLEFTNQQGQLTNSTNLWGLQLSEAYSDLLQTVMNQLEDDGESVTSDNEDDIDIPTDDDEQIQSTATRSTLLRQDNRRDETQDDAWEIHNYEKRINKTDLINFLRNFIATNTSANEFNESNKINVNDNELFKQFLKNTLMGFIDNYVDESDKEKYKQDLEHIFRECFRYLNFTRIRYDTMLLSEFLLLVLSFVSQQPANFIDSYVRGIIRETTVSYNRGVNLSCPKGAYERMWTLLGDLSQTFEGQLVYTENKYMQLYAIINNIFNIDYDELINKFTKEWYDQLQISDSEPLNDNRQTNINFYRNYMLHRMNIHLNQMFPNVSSQEETNKINDYKIEFAKKVDERIANPPPELDEAFDYVYKSTEVTTGGRINKKRTTKKHTIIKKRSTKKSIHKKKKTTKRYNTNLNKKRTTQNKITKKRQLINKKRGGFLNTIGFGIDGVQFSRQTGKKQYNWQTGKWDNMNCYKIGPLPEFCRINKSTN